MYGACQHCSNAATPDGRVATTSAAANANDANLPRFACLWDVVPSAAHGIANYN